MAGHMRHRGGDSWYLEYTAGTDYTGKRKRYTKTVHGTERQAKKELARFVVECDDGVHDRSGSMSVKSLCDIYMKEYAERFHKTSTLGSDRTSINVWIIPLLGKKKLNKLKKLDVQQWVNDISDAGKSPKTVRNHFSVLRNMLNYAIDMDLIEHNPCENVRMPKKITPEARCFSKDELSLLLNGLDNLDYEQLKFKCCILLALFGGMRKGEVMGLDWNDVDLKTGIITIRRTRMVSPGLGVYEDTPKTESSRRTLSLPLFVTSELSRLRTQQLEERIKFGGGYSESDALIKSEDGEPLHPQTVQRWFTSFCESINIPAHGLHALRHTHASLLANMGVDKVQVSKRLGHSQISTTLNIYTHLFENVDDTISSQLETYHDILKDAK